MLDIRYKDEQYSLYELINYQLVNVDHPKEALKDITINGRALTAKQALTILKCDKAINR